MKNRPPRVLRASAALAACAMCAVCAAMLGCATGAGAPQAAGANGGSANTGPATASAGIPDPQAASLQGAAAAGDTKEAALEVCMPAGERAYLDRLVCADGSPPSYRRSGSVGQRTEPPTPLTNAQQEALLRAMMTGAPLKPGEPDLHIIDAYELTCGPAKQRVYMDMYHCSQSPPAVPPRGFRLRDAR